MSLSVVNSKAVFLKALKDIGLEVHADRMEEMGYTTYGELAYAFNFSPGNPSDEAFDNALVIPLFGTATSTKKNLLRRLHFESYTVAMHACQNLTSKAEDEVKPAKLPTPERTARMEVLKGKYPGIQIEGELDPSFALIDKLHTMKVSGELRVLRWEELTK